MIGCGILLRDEILEELASIDLSDEDKEILLSSFSMKANKEREQASYLFKILPSLLSPEQTERANSPSFILFLQEKLSRFCPNKTISVAVKIMECCQK